MIDSKVSLNDLWGVITRLKDDTSRCLTALEATPEDDGPQRSFWRRMYALAIFAFFDGVTYRMAFHAHAARFRRDVAFSPEEMARLESAYDFDEDADEPVSTFSQSRMIDDVRFAFNAFARVHYSDYVLPLAAPEWALLREVARIRTNLQHPREPRVLEVYEENVEEMLEALRWFVERAVDLLEDCLTRSEAKVDEWDEEEGGAVM